MTPKQDFAHQFRAELKSVHLSLETNPITTESWLAIAGRMAKAAYLAMRLALTLTEEHT